MLKKMPRVAAIHDMSGYGKCSLTVAIPVISASGVEVCPLPTALLSTNTNFPNFTLFDFTDEMDGYISHWESISLCFDAVYSGFLGSAEQIGHIHDFIKKFSPKQIVIDPVMGDNGIIYKTYTPEMCERMRTLVPASNVLLPNLTEACALTNTDYQSADTSSQGVKTLGGKLIEMGAANVVIKGIERGDKLYNCIITADDYIEREIDLLPYRMHGTGDLFASVVVGALLNGKSLIEAIDKAAVFVYEVMEFSRTIEESDERGACFEPLLYKLAK